LVLMGPTEPDQKVRSDDLRGERLRGGTIDIHGRTFAFAVRTLQLVRSLPNGLAGRTIARQLARSGTSIGANVEEAQGGHSKAEFARRMGIARSEAREALCWRRLIIATKMIAPDRLVGIRREGEEIAKILITVVKKARWPQNSANLGS
jgi:four helix bundle protein